MHAQSLPLWQGCDSIDCSPRGDACCCPAWVPGLVLGVWRCDGCSCDSMLCQEQVSCRVVSLCAVHRVTFVGCVLFFALYSAAQRLCISCLTHLLCDASAVCHLKDCSLWVGCTMHKDKPTVCDAQLVAGECYLNGFTTAAASLHVLSTTQALSTAL